MSTSSDPPTLREDAPDVRTPIGAVRLRRSKTDSVVAGVCGGLGAALGVDPLWFRLGFVVLALGGGSGVLIYLVAWLLMPEEDDDRPIVRAASAAKGSIIAGMVLVGIGVMLLVDSLVPWFDRVFWPVAVIGAGAALVYSGGRR